MNARTTIGRHVGIIVGIDAFPSSSAPEGPVQGRLTATKTLPPSQLRQDEEHQTLVWLRRPYHGGPLLTHGTTATRN